MDMKKVKRGLRWVYLRMKMETEELSGGHKLQIQFTYAKFDDIKSKWLHEMITLSSLSNDDVSQFFF